MAGRGYIRLYRDLMSNDFYAQKPFDKTHAWIDLQLSAQFSDHTYNGKDVRRGEVLMSISSLADRWGWDGRKVKRFLLKLQDAGRVVLNSDWSGSVIYLTKYDTEQSADTASDDTDSSTDMPSEWYNPGAKNGITDGITNGITYGMPETQYSCGVSGTDAQPMVQPMVQPMAQPDGTKWYTYNNESYNNESKNDTSIHTPLPSEGENRKTRKSRSAVKPSLKATDSVIVESGLPDSVIAALQDWTAYCRDIKKPVGQTQARILIGEIQSHISQRGEEQVVSVIRTCIANGYKNLVWDLADKTPAAAKPAAATTASTDVRDILTRLVSQAKSDYFFQRKWDDLPELLKTAIGSPAVAKSFNKLSEFDRSQAFRKVETEYNRLLQEQNQHTTQGE